MTLRGSRARRRAALETGAEADAGDEPGAARSTLDVQRLPLADIDLSGRNPRRKLSDIDELVASIQAHGLLAPVLVRRTGQRYELVAGNRRLEAVRRLGWDSVPAVVRAADIDQAYVLTLVENLQRTDLQPTEEAAALEVLIRERGWTTRQVAAAIGRSQAWVSKRLRVFEDPLLAPAVLANQLSVSAAEELLTLAETRRYALLSLAIDQHWDRGQVRRAARDRFAANQPLDAARPPGLTRRIHQFRLDMRDVPPEVLTDSDRRELRMLFSELALLARAPTQARRQVFPPLPGS